MSGVVRALACAVALAALSTLGDFIWANFIDEHRVVYSLVHGTLLLAAIGGSLGYFRGRVAAGALGGALIGLTAAAGFYVLAPVFGFGVMFFLWFAMWIAFAAIQGRLITRGGPVGGIIGRGLLAGIGSGVAFYGVSDIWIPFDPQGWDYAVHFISWIVAYLPAFLALLVERRLGKLRK